MPVTLREVTRENWEECANPRLPEDQSGFVESNLYSLAESRFWPTYIPLAVYYDDTMVGFVMYGLEPADNTWWVSRLMIDERYQGKGYGRAAMQQVIERPRETPGCQEVLLGYSTDNRAAQRLYASLGFEEMGIDEDGDMVARLRLRG